MKIHDSRIRLQFPFFNKKKLSFKSLTIGLVLLNLIFIIIIVFLGKAKVSYIFQGYSKKFKDKIDTTYNKIVTPNVEKIELDVSFEDWQKIEKKRKEALDKGILLANDSDTVNATLKYQNQSIPVEIRLKGDWTDHLEGKKWSFRIKVKDNHAYKGMKYFSIQDPNTRQMANEWLFLQAVKDNGLIALRYNFVDVTINGESKGIYAVKEHFSKELVENNQRREGPIFKFDESQFWQDLATYGNETDEEIFLSEITSLIIPFKGNALSKTESLSNQFLEAKRLLENYRLGKLDATEVFDLDSWAKLYALSDLFGVRHGLTVFNLRMYYNPVTGKIEPIAYDNNIEKRISYLSINSHDTLLSKFGDILNNKDFLTSYVNYLNHFSNPGYLDSFLDNLNDDLFQIEKILGRDYSYKLNQDFFYMNSNFIFNKLNNGPHIRAELTSDKRVLITSLSTLPIEVLGIKLLDKNIVDFSTDPRIIYSKSAYLDSGMADPIEITKIVGPFNIKDLKVEYRLLGLNKTFSVALESWVNLNEDVRYISQSLTKTSNPYYIGSGMHVITKDIIVPPNSKLVVTAGAELDFTNRSRLISYSPIFFQGSEEKPIKVGSSDSTGQGILVLNSSEESQLSYTSFSNLHNIDSQGNNITGAVTFYESPVEIRNCEFADNQSEDQLNIVRSTFLISDSSFSNSSSDALDLDFSNGEINNSFFINLYNDAVDASGSEIKINNIFVDGAGDKAVSAGEASKITVKDSEIKNSNIGYASKDQSELTVYLGAIDQTKIGYAAYQKKPEYGPAHLIIWNTLISNLSRQWLIESGSVIQYNGNDYTETETNVYKHLLESGSSYYIK